jgi:hypothetical protein
MQMTFLPPFPRFLFAAWLVGSLGGGGFTLAFGGGPWWGPPAVISAIVAMMALFGLLLEGPRIFTNHTHI